MKILKRLLISLIVTIAIIGVVVIGGYIYIRSAFGIDLFNTIGQIKTLGQSVDESSLCPNAYDYGTDMAGAKAEIDSSISGLITFSPADGYGINFNLSASPMLANIELSDKQVGALVQTIVNQEMNGEIEVNGKKVPIHILQVTISDILDGNAAFNIVVKLDIRSFKEDMNAFPYSIIVKYIPDYIYLSSTTKVVKGETAFSYSIVHDKLAINNLDAAATTDLMNTLDKVMRIGTAEDLNLSVGQIVMQTLIGDDSNNGIAKALRPLGAVDYTFRTIDTVGYFVIEI